jgi:hypothetical protein
MTSLRARLRASASVLALAGIMVACDGQRQTEPTPPADGPNFAQIANEWVVLDPLTIPNPCATTDPTQPAFVTISGKFHVHVESNLDPLNPTAHLHINSANFKGEGTTALIGGQPTGDDYRGKLSDNTRLRIDPLAPSFTTQDQTKFFLINKEGGPTAMNDLIVTARVFVNDGKIQWLDATVECGAIDTED